MAKLPSGKIVGTKYISSRYWMEIRWSSKQNVSSNNSSVTVEMWLVSGDDGSINYTATKDGSITINGTTTAFDSTTDVSHGSGGGATKIYTKTVTIAHNSDGKKSIGLSGWFKPAVSISGNATGTWSVSGTANLGAIAVGTANIYRGDSGGWDQGQAWVYNGSAWKKAVKVYVYNGSAWKQSI